MGETGCVSWMFEKKGIILVNNNVCVEDEFMMLVLDAGAEDLQTVREYYQVLCAQTDLDAVKKAIETQNITIENAETSWLANNTIEVEGEAYRKALQLIEALEDHDDVNSVYSNLNFAQEFFEAEK
jgi:transcriptional/translational regulatory protein YebC/TACO1